MTAPEQAHVDVSITDVEVKPNLKQRQLQRLKRAMQATMDFFERVVRLGFPKSALESQASSSALNLHAPLRARWSVRVMIGGLLLLLWWSSIGKIDQVTRAQAQIIAAERTQFVQSSDGGVVTKLHVKEGDVVKAGQLPR